MNGVDLPGHLDWFRNASPYIHAHRGGTFVLAFDGEAVVDPRFDDLIHDIALLARLGVRLVLVHGARPQIEQRLKEADLAVHYHNGRRITDSAALPRVCEAVGRVRTRIEASLSTGLPNTPMAGAGIRVSGGNHVTARPWGVHDGVDFQQTGVVRRIDAHGIDDALDRGEIVLLSPLGYSATGEVFNLHAEDIATETAVSLRADKLLFLRDTTGVTQKDGNVISRLTPAEAEAHATSAASTGPTDDQLACAASAVRRGVRRIHLIARSDGALLAELYTRDGAGTLVTADTYEGLRRARIGDVAGILELIEPLEAEGALVRRSREQLELEIEYFRVIERDGTVIACAALYPQPDGTSAEIACVAVHADYRGAGRGRQLLDGLEQDAHESGLTQLFVLSTRTMHWFRERGFEPDDLDNLPGERRALYNWQRNSKVFVKTIAA